MDYAAATEPSAEGSLAPIQTFGRLEVAVLCWDGAPTDWTFTIDWENSTGDDDDSACDDDDSAGDDDDSAGDDDDSGEDSGSGRR